MTVSKSGAVRQYRSQLRQQQARRTRVAVLDAAHTLFVARGYGATTMRQIAAEAGVSVESVYAQGSKSALLLACVDRALAGDDEPVPLLDRSDLRAAMEARDDRDKLRLLQTAIVRRLPKLVPVLQAFSRAAAVDDEIAAAWREHDRLRYEDSARIVAAFAPSLRPGLSRQAATDLLWLLLSTPLAAMLHAERGWTTEAYAEWLVDAIDRLLLRP